MKYKYSNTAHERNRVQDHNTTPLKYTWAIDVWQRYFLRDGDAVQTNVACTGSCDNSC